MLTIAMPQPGEYVPYAIDYIKLVPDDGQVLTHLKNNAEALRLLIHSFPLDSLTTPCAPGEWTIQEILVHIMDTERVFQYRALRLARNDPTVLPGFDQEVFAPHSRANERSISSIMEEYDSIRAASLTLFNSFDEAAFTRIGSANNAPLSVRGALYIVVGHELYHINSIRKNYLGEGTLH